MARYVDWDGAAKDDGEEPPHRGRPSLYHYDDLVNRLFDGLADAPQGWTIHEIGTYLSVPRQVGQEVIRRLRRLLADTDQVNVVYRVAGRARKYILIGTLEDAKERLNIRLATYQEQFATETAILRSLVAGSDGRSREGRKARVVLRAFTRALEDVAEIDADAAAS